MNPENLASDPSVDSVLAEIDDSVTACLSERNLLSLIENSADSEPVTA
jgi:hypothetical protein